MSALTSEPAAPLETSVCGIRLRNPVIAALMVKRGAADAMLCGAVGQYNRHLQHITDIIGLKPGASMMAALSAIVMPKGTFFLCDTYVVEDPSAAQLAEHVTRLAVDADAADTLHRRCALEPSHLAQHSRG